MHHDRRIDFVLKLARRVGILRHDCVGVMRPMIVDVVNRFIHPTHHLHGENQVQILGSKIFVRCQLGPVSEDGLGLRIRPQRNACGG